MDDTSVDSTVVVVSELEVSVVELVDSVTRVAWTSSSVEEVSSLVSLV